MAVARQAHHARRRALDRGARRSIDCANSLKVLLHSSQLFNFIQSEDDDVNTCDVMGVILNAVQEQTE